MATELTRKTGILSAGGILDRIVIKRRERLEAAKRAMSLRELIEHCSTLDIHRPSFREALRRTDRVNIIAEVKRQSPSKGIIREDFDHLEIAGAYARAGASAISVLTEEDFFGGSLSYLHDICERVNVPLLRKDFVIDEYQLFEAKLAGASAVLLITAILGDELLSSFIKLAQELNLDALVEVHTVEEMRRAARADSKIIGVNNRDLTTFNVDLETSIKLATLAPQGAILVSESGITTVENIRYLQKAGYQAFLIGEHFMRQPDVGATLQGLIEGAN